MSAIGVKHWSEIIAEQVIRKKKEPFVIASGITTSGPTHMGTVCEFLYPSALQKYLQDKGYETKFLFIGDIMDAFDSIPASLKKYSKILAEDLGKPLCSVYDPYGCCESYGVHFLNECMSVMERLEVFPDVIRADELYKRGMYDYYARLFIEKLHDIVQIFEELSHRKLPADWKDILLPICKNCGKIATTTVINVHGDVVEYSCTKNVGYTKGCGYEGVTKISEHRYKLQWRLDWPSRQDFLNVSVEGAGADHHTSGGSWDTAVAVFKRIFKKDPPIGFKYGFLLYHGKKYSKSKGYGLGVKELLELAPPEIIKFVLFKPNIEENKEFDPAGYNLIRIFNEYNSAANLAEKKRKYTRAESKMITAYKLSTERRKWKVDFVDLLVNYQILGNWNEVANKLGDEEGVMYLKNYVEKWIEYGYIPDEYVFSFKPTRVEEHKEQIIEFAKRLEEHMSALDIHNLVYEIAEKHGLRASEFFKSLYKSIIGKEHGPRLGRLIYAIGVRKVKKSLLNVFCAH